MHLERACDIWRQGGNDARGECEHKLHDPDTEDGQQKLVQRPVHSQSVCDEEISLSPYLSHSLNTRNTMLKFRLLIFGNGLTGVRVDAGFFPHGLSLMERGLRHIDIVGTRPVRRGCWEQ